MDPNETLRRLRDLATTALAGDRECPDNLEFAELFDALDGWLCDKGFPPDDWKGDE